MAGALGMSNVPRKWWSSHSQRDLKPHGCGTWALEMLGGRCT